MKYTDILKRIDVQELADYYKNHLPSETIKKFNIDSIYLLNRLIDFLGIERHSVAYNTELQMRHMSDEQKAERGNKISVGNQNKIVSDVTKQKISQKQKGVPRPYTKTNPNSIATQFKSGHVPWNKGTHGLQHWVDGQSERRWNTLITNGTLGNIKSKIESIIEQDLINKFGEDHVHYQYSDSRYPFKCDFYIDSADLFIEVNNWWHHGPHPYDPNSVEDEDLLNYMREKAQNHPEQRQWEEAIKTWTQRDVKKFQTAKQNNLNYIAIYSYNNEFK